MPEQIEKSIEDRQQIIQIVDYLYAVICSACKKKVIDPDKKKNQIYLKDKCPSCGVVPQRKQQHHRVIHIGSLSSSDNNFPQSKKQMKKARKREERRLRKLANNINNG